MRSAPPLQVSVNRYGLWRVVVSVLALSAWSAMAVWWWVQPQPVPPSASAVAAVAVLAVVACVIALWRTPPLSLRWDRQLWHVAAIVPGKPVIERAGELAVAIDLGGWMLLRFVPEGEAPAVWRRRWPEWIPVQRAGLETRWHAFRCALYAARPALSSADAAPSEAPLV